MNAQPLKAPFPYFGGKSRVADLVWARLGDVRNYIEPFFGSGANLLRRPHEPKVETINDADCYVANFWRATQHEPEAVAAHADWPVNEADLHARHRYLVLSEDAAAFRERMRTDPDYYDARIAGWWAWGACMWIGGGWCSYAADQDRRPNQNVDGEQHGMLRPPPSQWREGRTADGDVGERTVQLTNNQGLHAGGVHAKRPSLGDANGGGGGKGVHGKKLLFAFDERSYEPIEKLMPEERKVAINLWDGRGNAANPSQRGVNQTLPQKRPVNCGNGGSPGVHRQADLGEDSRPQLADAYSRGRGVHGNDHAEACAERRAWL